MFYKFSRALKNPKGFTLVELMVVIVIIGILVAIAIPLYGGIQDRAKERACQANLRTIDGTVSMYHTETGNNPADVQALMTKGFLKEVPTCDRTTAAPAYTLTTGVAGGALPTATCACGASY